MTPRGNVSSEWRKKGEDGRLLLHVDIPVGTEASVWFPVEKTGNTRIWESGSQVWENGRFVAQVKGISNGCTSASGKFVVLQIRSGSYDFESCL
jgi:hypothetical protein